MALKTIETDPKHDTVGRFFNAHDGAVYLCDSYDPRIGFWMTDIADARRRANVSERAIGRTFHPVRSEEKLLGQVTGRKVLICIGAPTDEKGGYDVAHSGLAISRMTADEAITQVSVLIPAEPAAADRGRFSFDEEIDPKIVVTLTRSGGTWVMTGHQIEAPGLVQDDAVTAIGRAIAHARHLHSEMDHDVTLKATGFWGQRGAGCVIVARDTGRVLLPFRSKEVEQPNTWGTWGGAINLEITPEEAVAQEVREEAGYDGEFELIPAYVFSAPTGTFRYFNFVAVVESEFEPKLNWETDDFGWFTPGDWPEPLHFGLKGLLDDEESLASIKAVSEKSPSIS